MIWNLCMSIFSIICVIRIVPYFLTVLYRSGPWYFVCRNGMASYGKGGPVGLWCVLFVYSKYLELADTAFLILRKRPVSFLHWYHHATVLLLCIHSLATYSPAALVMSSINAVVHSIMYTYYFVAAVSSRPQSWGRIVTKIQIGQMFVGVALGVSNYIGKCTSHNCYSVSSHAALVLGIYCSYLVLFLRFYASKYI